MHHEQDLDYEAHGRSEDDWEYGDRRSSRGEPYPTRRSSDQGPSRSASGRTAARGRGAGRTTRSRATTAPASLAAPTGRGATDETAAGATPTGSAATGPRARRRTRRDSARTAKAATSSTTGSPPRDGAPQAAPRSRSAGRAAAPNSAPTVGGARRATPVRRSASSRTSPSASPRTPDVDASQIEVSVEGDVVFLRGRVYDRGQKRAAEDVVETVSGVRDVRNELDVEKGMLQELTDAVTGPRGRARARDDADAAAQDGRLVTSTNQWGGRAGSRPPVCRSGARGKPSRMSDAARPPDCISLDEHRDDQHRLERSVPLGASRGAARFSCSQVSRASSASGSEDGRRTAHGGPARAQRARARCGAASTSRAASASPPRARSASRRWSSTRAGSTRSASTPS